MSTEMTEINLEVIENSEVANDETDRNNKPSDLIYSGRVCHIS